MANLVIIFVLTYVTQHLYYYLKNDKFAPQIASLVDELIVYAVILKVFRLSFRLCLYCHFD